MKSISQLLFFFFFTFSSAWGQYCTVTTQSASKGQQQTKVNVYLDKSESMYGFWNAPFDDERYVGKIFTHLQNFLPRRITYYTFASQCDKESLGQRFAKVPKTFEGAGNYNVYSTAIQSLIEQRKKGGENEISLLVTDGVPSLADSHTPMDNYRQRLYEERDNISDVIEKYIYEGGKENVILVYRYLARYKGQYAFSDPLPKGTPITRKDLYWDDRRNFYIVAFATRSNSKMVDDLLMPNNDEEWRTRFDMRCLNPIADNNIYGLNASGVKLEDGKVKFQLRLHLAFPFQREHFVLCDAKGNLTNGILSVNSESNGGVSLSCELPTSTLQEGENMFRLAYRNRLNTDEGNQTFLKDLEIGRTKDFEVDAFTADSSFYHRTFRLAYLIDPIVQAQKSQQAQDADYNRPRYAFDLPFMVTYEQSWARFAEPLFGLIGSPAPFAEFYHTEQTFLLPYAVQLLLIRWLCPLLILLVLFGGFFNYSALSLQNPKQQLTLWLSGLVLIASVVLLSTAVYMFHDYSEGQLPLSYQVLHFIWNPLMSLLLFAVGSFLLSRRRWCTLVNKPLPF